MKLSMRNLWIVPVRLIILSPFWVLWILGDAIGMVGQKIEERLPGVEYRD